MNITKLIEDYNKCEESIEGIRTRAAEENRDVNDAEQVEVDAFKTRSTELLASIEEAGERQSARAKVNAVMANFGAGPGNGGEGIQTRSHVGAHQDPETVTPGEYVSLLIRSMVGDLQGNPDEDAKAAFGAYRERLTRAATSGVLTRSVAEQVISDNLGVVPTFIIGDVIKFVDSNRYLVGRMRSLPMPQGGKTFTRPRVTQRTLAGQQTNEFDELTSRAMLLTGDTVTKETHGTVISLSEQDIDWTDPAMLDIVIEDMGESYAIDTESTACAAVQAAATNTLPFDQSGDPAAFIQAAASGAASLYGNAKKLPDAMLASVDMWAYLVGLVDSTGRQLFPNLGPVNAPGTLDLTDFSGNPMGLPLVVSPEFTSGFLCLAATRYLEAYEQNKGFLQIPAPSTLSVTVAYRGYFATNVKAQGLLSLTAA